MPGTIPSETGHKTHGCFGSPHNGHTVGGTRAGNCRWPCQTLCWAPSPRRTAGHIYYHTAHRPPAAHREPTFCKKYIHVEKKCPRTNMSIIDGRAISSELRASIAAEIRDLKAQDPSFAPRLVIIQVGDRPDSSTYVKMKLKSCQEVGIDGSLQKLPDDVSEADLLARINELNEDPSVHGILVQLPLPAHLDEERITNAVKQEKDIDGFSELNLAAIFKKNAAAKFIPCTPKGIMYLLKHEQVEIAGKNVVVCGRSDIVGGPLSKLLEKAGGTVTVVHSKTSPEQLKFYCSNADIIVSAVGRAGFITGDMVKQGCVIIDVGTNYVPDATRKTGQRMCGDVDFASCKEKASKITPVPGGVGPMTVAMVLDNLLESAKRSKKV
ncbi:hypothetical protein KL911_004645 [Ogataea haglerorum]|uniref:uncharacterized protein n=1 Tax=Ogataea haglerorum TaxID=1937702 RepID=UPI001C8A41C0|nr:uncharacterized protein KL911_004645 [Ogataea haglerorum]KAG7750766.1 hypothetical protein KL911_004645 [Ogataea haglerorum]